MRKHSLLVSLGIFTWILSGLLCQHCAAFAGTTDQLAGSDSPPTLPDAPSALPAQSNQTVQIATENHRVQEGMQTKRILGIVPNFEAVSTNVKLPRQSAKQKFKAATEDSFDYSSFVLLEKLSRASGKPPRLDSRVHQGAAGYARYYWHTFLDQTDENYLVEFAFPVALHQDGRYYTLGRGGVL